VLWCVGHLLLTLLGNNGPTIRQSLLRILIIAQILLLILESAVAIIQSYVFAVLRTLYSRASTVNCSLVEQDLRYGDPVLWRGSTDFLMMNLSRAFRCSLLLYAARANWLSFKIILLADVNILTVTRFSNPVHTITSLHNTWHS
jgi:hypothetical protein